MHHKYGLACEETFSLEELGLGHIPLDKISKENEQLCNMITPFLIEWVNKNYYHDDAMPGWEVVPDKTEI